MIIAERIYMRKNIDHGKRKMFVVKLLFYQNKTWHGSITWIEDNEVQFFKSTSEMFKLIKGVLNEEMEEEMEEDSDGFEN